MSIISKNKKISLNYEILKRYTAGISLLGHEVKSLKHHHVSLEGVYVTIREQDNRFRVVLRDLHIPPYQKANETGSNADRDRLLLLESKEIRSIQQELNTKGVTVVPTAIVLVRGMIKVELALVRGKKKYDKRQDIKRRDQQRDSERDSKARFK